MKTKLALALILPLILVLSVPGISEEEKTTPERIIIEPPQQAALSVNLHISRTRYPPKGELEVEIQLTKRAYLYLYSIDQNGNVALLFPNKYDQKNLLNAGKHKFPRQGYSILVENRQETEYLQAIATTIPISNFASIGEKEYSDNPFPILSNNAESFQDTTKKNIESQARSGEWSTDWVKYEVTPYLSTLEIYSQPPGADIYVHDRYLGSTPAQVHVKPGYIELTLSRRNFEKWTSSVQIGPYKTKQVNAILSPSTQAWLFVRSKPEGARVVFNDEYKGKTPVGFSVTDKEGYLQITKEGYTSWEESIEVQPYRTNTIDVNLQTKEYGTLAIDSVPAGASIFIDGKFKGLTPMQLYLEAGRLRIEIGKDGYRKWSKFISLPSNQYKSVFVTLTPLSKKEAAKETTYPAAGLGVNVGLDLDGILSFGAEIEFMNFLVGGSLRFTGDPKAREEMNWVQKYWENGEIINYGPEWEIYSAYLADLFRGLNLRLGAGLAVQPLANLAPVPAGTSSNSYQLNPQATVARDAHSEFSTAFTVHGGVTIKRENLSLSFFYHNLRGFTFGLGFVFS